VALTPVGADGITQICTLFADDEALTIDVLLEHRAWAWMWYVPTAVKVCDALEEEFQLENVESSQAKRYSTEWPWLHVALPVE
jgi:hypothetical protein